MAKRARKLDIQKLIKQGRGSGSGSNYKPWLIIQDVASKGRRTRLRGNKTGRQHEFLSDMERNYFYILEYADCVIDIREQYPLLPIEETMTIANELGLRHPENPETGQPIVMTTDFLITKQVGDKLINVARTIKSKDELMNKRISEKFEIERVYWERREVDWAIVTEEEINKTIAANISSFHSYYNIEELEAFADIDEKEREDLIIEYIKRIVDNEKSIREISSAFDKDMSLLKGTGIAVFKHLLARKLITVDLSQYINIENFLEINLSHNVFEKEFNIL